MKSNQNQYSLARVKILPRFFRMKKCQGEHTNVFGNVLAETDSHFSKGWITVGIVSKQSPFGQGTYLGFPINDLRPATKDEIALAINQHHPHGRDFRPHCQNVADATFHLMMSDCIENWTDDKKSNVPPVMNISRQEIESFRTAAAQKHLRVLKMWHCITGKQRKSIERQLVV